MFFLQLKRFWRDKDEWSGPYLRWKFEMEAVDPTKRQCNIPPVAPADALLLLNFKESPEMQVSSAVDVEDDNVVSAANILFDMSKRTSVNPSLIL